MLIVLLMLLPLLCAGLIVVNPKGQAKYIATGATLVSVVIALVAILQFDFSRAEVDQLQIQKVVEQTPGGVVPPGELLEEPPRPPQWVPALGLEFSVAVDSVSLLLIALTVLLGPICVIGSFSAVKQDVKTYYAWLLVLQSAMIGVFAARDLVLFYICFEFTLIPMYVLISLYGSANRKKAATKFFLYTFTGSVIALAGFVYVVWYHASLDGNTWSFDLATLGESARLMSPTQQGWILLALLAGFAVKVPLFPVHTWLPLAHTEAPTAGSVILAGVLLKLGTYGIYKFVLPYAPEAVVEHAPLIGALSVIGIVYAGLICWVQTDVKKLVAYSSVSHLGFCVLGLVAINSVGVAGSVMYMISHGFSTGALFLMIGMMYERYHTRSMREVGGLGSKMPVWSSFMVFFVMASVGLPGLNGFVSEIMCLMGTFMSYGWTGEGGIAPGGTPGTLGPWFAFFAGTGMIVAAMYLLIMTGKMVWGTYREPEGHHEHDELPTDLNGREIGLLVPLAAGCLLFGLYPKPLLSAIEAPVNQTVSYYDGIVESRMAQLAERAGDGDHTNDEAHHEEGSH